MATLQNGFDLVKRSTKAINELSKQNFAQGIIESTNNLMNRKTNKLSFTDAIKAAHKKGGKLDAEWDVERIAGSAVGVGIGARLISGGGIYRDKDGNANLIGIPFI